MREPPRLADAAISAALESHYDISGAALTFLPIGNDAASSVYRIDAPTGARFFLKARAGVGFSEPSLLVPRILHDQGAPQIVAPLPTVTRALWVMVGDFALSLYPYIDGRTGTDVGLSEEHWRTFGALVRQIHSTQLAPEVAQVIPRETFTPSRRNVITEMEAAIDGQTIFVDPLQRALAAFWTLQRDKIRKLMEQADALARQLRQAHAPLVLCHADLHTWNVLIDAARQLWLVDWDETILALKERDLMFVIGGIGRGLVQPHETACFLQGYGDATINQNALTYYRYAWAVQDMAAYGELVFFSPQVGEITRRDALHSFTDMFEPGNIVDIAIGSIIDESVKE